MIVVYQRRCIQMTPNGWRRALSILIRPYEVANLLRIVPISRLSKNFSFVKNVANWVNKNLEYIPDPDRCELPLSPAETINRGGGDCEDLAGVAVSLLIAGNIPCRIVLGLYSGIGHAWVEGRDNRGWFLLEATTGQLYRRRRPRNYVEDRRLMAKLR